eukprot:scaffold455736_cov33-Prasinocladus_malaysianus.AAC.1
MHPCQLKGVVCYLCTCRSVRATVTFPATMRRTQLWARGSTSSASARGRASCRMTRSRNLRSSAFSSGAPRKFCGTSSLSDWRPTNSTKKENTRDSPQCVLLLSSFDTMHYAAYAMSLYETVSYSLTRPAKELPGCQNALPCKH